MTNDILLKHDYEDDWKDFDKIKPNSGQRCIVTDGVTTYFATFIVNNEDTYWIYRDVSKHQEIVIKGWMKEPVILEKYKTISPVSINLDNKQ